MNGTTIYLDFETGGVEERHPNIQIAAVAVRDWMEVEAFERKIVFDPAACDPEALRINGYTPEAWVDAVPERQAASEFRGFMEDHADMQLRSARTGNLYKAARLAGHNIATFDIPRLKKIMGPGFWPGCWWYPLDTYQRAIWYFTERRLPLPRDFQLQTLAAHFGIEVEKAHEALSDVRTCVKVAERLCA